MTSTSSSSGAPFRFRAKKRFGQHFLSDANILNRIVDAAEIAPDEAVMEIGPGLGALTTVLAQRAHRVVAVEVDRELIESLRQRFAGAPHVSIVERDVLDAVPSELLAAGSAAAPYVVVANLPYNIAAPTLRLFLEGDVRPRRLVVMVQLEVAEAICARPPKMGLLSVATQVYGETSMVMKVAPGAFNPPPKVQSAVVRIDVAERPRVNVPLDAFFHIARAGFGNPRKMLRNSLSFGLRVKQEIVDQVMAAAGVDASLRPHVLTLDDWAAVTRAWISRTSS
ncbi:MAG TPA: 16S rRNA (adenine(1518)-N(6)/adenine(1519)-N(6))-dimethyltransferase RsmA [Dehalococcoidia bacterium]|nr:16S rRNA (adenine(1518)-N(6)/adenine(1519)-N(6))-dimethyltransferase RsmA [Dehalococcoidia bacterium]